MAEKKRGKKRKEEYVGPGEDKVEKPSKEEYAVAKWLRKNVAIKKTKFLNHNVEYFTASRAVDALLESHWGKGDEPMFPSREVIVEFMDTMLRHKFFHRARKVPVSEQELKGKKKDKKKDAALDSGDDKKKDKDEKEKNEIIENEQKSDTGAEGKEKEKKKRKIRLDMHIDQQFVDGLDAYVWIYDPIPIYYWFFGALLVLGATGVCLFPLWPPSVRKGVYYLSVAAAGFLVFIIALAVLRFVMFCFVWMVTMGKHHIWLLPNLTEDVGFFASFWPLYKYEYKGGDSIGSNKKGDKKKKKKDKDSDAEEEERDMEETKSSTTSAGIETVRERRKLSQHSQHSAVDEDRQSEKSESAANTDGGHGDEGGSESESESSQRSSTGRDFEMVDQDDLES